MPQIPNHRQQSTLAMPFTETCKSHATNRTSSHSSCQQIVYLAIHADTSKSRQQIVNFMPQTDSKPGKTNRPSYHASHSWKQITGNQIIRPTLAHTDTSNTQATNHMDTNKSQATNTMFYHSSYTYQKFTGSKKVILPCLTHIPAKHRKKSYIVPCLRYKQITSNKAHLLCLSRKLANHRQQIVHLPIASHKYQQHTSKTSHIFNVSYRYQKITGHFACDDACLRTPLLHASSRGHVEVVQLLLARAADPDIQDAAQKPPLDRAAKNATELLMPTAADPANAY